MTRTHLTGLDLSYHASGLPDRDAYLTTVATCLSDGMPGDLTGWNDLDRRRTPRFWFNEAEAYRIYGALAAVIDEHPLVVHRRAHPDAEPVRRVSDCISDRAFRSGRVYRDLFVPMPAGSPVGPYEKIDAALNDGIAGPDNLIQTITGDLGIPINHYVELQFDGPLSPGLMRPPGSEDYLYVIMPIRVAM